MNRIKIKQTGIPLGVQRIVNQLPNSDEINSTNSSLVTLEFSKDTFIYEAGLVLLAAWRKSLHPGVQVTVDDYTCKKSTKDFLTNTGFREIIDTGHETPSVQPKIGRVPLRPITNEFAKEAMVNEVVSIFDEYAHHVEDMNPFRVMISELCENTLVHSKSTSPGYIGARVMETSHGRIAEIAIADTGIGILESYRTGTNEDAKARIDKGANPLEIAIDGLVSSKPTIVPGHLRSHRGFGLLIVRRLIEENRGQMLIVSGTDSLHLKEVRNRRSKELTKPFTGTFIGLVFDLSRPLPLAEIYESIEERYVDPSQEKMISSRQPDATDSMKSRAENMSNNKISDSASIDDDTSPEKVSQEVPLTDTGTTVKRIELRHYGTELLTRDAGTAIRADIASFLATGGNVEVSLNDVTDITPSVADESFAKLSEIMGYSEFEKRVEITGGTKLILRLIDFVIKTRRRIAG